MKTWPHNNLLWSDLMVLTPSKLREDEFKKEIP